MYWEFDISTVVLNVYRGFDVPTGRFHMCIGEFEASNLSVHGV